MKSPTIVIVFLYPRIQLQTNLQWQQQQQQQQQQLVPFLYNHLAQCICEESALCAECGRILES